MGCAISVLELAVPVWHPGLTQSEVTQIERVQKTALHIILGTKYTSYNEALKSVNLRPLENRRENACLKFAKQTLRSPKFSTWFVKNTTPNHGIETRSKKMLLKPVTTRTVRYEKSAMPYLTELLNNCTWTEKERLFW